MGRVLRRVLIMMVEFWNESMFRILSGSRISVLYSGSVCTSVLISFSILVI